MSHRQKFSMAVAGLDVREGGWPRAGRFECIASSFEKSNFGDPSFRHPERTRSRQESVISLLLLSSSSLPLPSGGHVDGLIHSSDFFEQQLFLVEQDHHFFERGGSREGEGRAHHIRTSIPPSHFVTRPKQTPPRPPPLHPLAMLSTASRSQSHLRFSCFFLGPWRLIP